jgi:ribose/xylose/arabinose/galactoside ABC-type transport system permease subunit
MKQLNNLVMEQINGGGYTSGFCSTISGIRGAVGLYNAAIAAGVIGGAALATGGGVIAVVVAGCAIYGMGNAWGWWS